MPISFYCQLQSFRLKNKKLLSEWVLLVAYIHNKSIDKLDFVFCDDAYLLELNKEFLAHHTLTDVLTFDYSENSEINAEIYISIERIKENAITFSSSFLEELNRVMIHSVLHCIGFSDKTGNERRTMRHKEDKCLEMLYEMTDKYQTTV